MRTSDIATYAVNNLVHRQSRSWLTILGIVIGIASVVALLTIGQGFSKSINAEFEKLAFDVIYVMPIAEGNLASSFSSGGMMPASAGKLTDNDVARLRRIPEIQETSRVIERRATVAFKDKEVTAMIDGIEPGVFEKTTSIGMAEGRFLVESDRRAVVIGSSASEEMFKPKTVGVGSYLLLNGVKYRVIGIIEKSGSSLGGELDNMILIPFTESRELFSDSVSPDEMDVLAVTLRPGADGALVEEAIKVEMDASHKVREGDRDYSVITPQMMMESINQILSLVTVFLGAIAAISLVVGGLSIMNNMFTSVMERTREIGILKAVGATEGDILKLFVFEAGMIGAAGGAAGTAVALLLVFIGTFFGLPAAFGFEIPLFGLLFAFGVGVASGYLPARMAAKLSPVDALRYE